jgi:hypothetical protein
MQKEIESHVATMGNATDSRTASKGAPSPYAPLPWRVVTDKTISLTLTDIEGADGSPVCEFCVDEKSDAVHAAVIVHRVNVHDDLLAALKSVANSLSDTRDVRLGNDDDGCEAVRLARAAIAKAEGR